MHSLESLRVINDLQALKGSRQKYNRASGQLINCATGEISSQRTFANAGQAAEYCEKYGAEYAGISGIGEAVTA